MRRLLLGTTERQCDLGLLLLRLWVGPVLALAHGLGKIRDLGSFTEAVANMGLVLPAVLAPAAAAAEALGGVLLALGLATRAAAASVVATMGVAAFVVHAGDPFGRKELALAYGLAALVLTIAGGGRWSIDRRLTPEAG